MKFSGKNRTFVTFVKVLNLNFVQKNANKIKTPPRLSATPFQVEAEAHARSPIQNGVQTKGCMDMVAYMTFQLKKCPVLQIILSFVE